MTDMPTLRAAFRTTVSGGGKYEMVFRFPSIEAMHTADDEWRAALSQPPEASEVEVVAWSYELATAHDGEEYYGWTDRLTPYKPNVPEGSNRNLVPLYARPPKPADQLGEARQEVAALREAERELAPWMSAALDDPASGEAFKAAANAWLEALTKA